MDTDHQYAADEGKGRGDIGEVQVPVLNDSRAALGEEETQGRFQDHNSNTEGFIVNLGVHCWNKMS